MDILKKLLSPLILRYFWLLTRIQLQKTHPRIVGIAGSTGKTSLANLVTTVLEEKYTVKQTHGKNSAKGIPLSTLQLNVIDSSLGDWLRLSILGLWKLLTLWERYQIYVMEMGIDGPNEPDNMGYLLKYVRPSVTVVTNVAIEHSVYFDPYVQGSTDSERREALLNMISKEETSLLTHTPSAGTAVINLDDLNIKKVMPHIYANILTISLYDKKADFFVPHLMITKDAFVMEFIYQKKSHFLKLQHPLPSPYAYELLFAIAIGTIYGVPVMTSIAKLEKSIELPPGRMSIFEGIQSTTIIDSSYNASLLPMLAMLDFLKTIGRHQRKIAILGDMRELGSQSKHEHQEVADKIIRTADEAILIGPLMYHYALPILEKKKFPVHSFATVTQAKEYILSTVTKHDVILVKGSQNTLFLERVVEMLLANKHDVTKLCRQGEFWERKKKGIA